MTAAVHAVPQLEEGNRRHCEVALPRQRSTPASVASFSRGAAGPFAVELAHAQMSYGAVLVVVAAVLMLAGVVFASAEHARRA
jgi:hypothetical protein